MANHARRQTDRQEYANGVGTLAETRENNARRRASDQLHDDQFVQRGDPVDPGWSGKFTPLKSPPSTVVIVEQQNMRQGTTVVLVIPLTCALKPVTPFLQAHLHRLCHRWPSQADRGSPLRGRWYRRNRVKREHARLDLVRIPAGSEAGRSFRPSSMAVPSGATGRTHYRGSAKRRRKLLSLSIPREYGEPGPQSYPRPPTSRRRVLGPGCCRHTPW